jgi:hypothetical protein
MLAAFADIVYCDNEHNTNEQHTPSYELTKFDKHAPLNPQQSSLLITSSSQADCSHHLRPSRPRLCQSRKQSSPIPVQLLTRTPTAPFPPLTLSTVHQMPASEQSPSSRHENPDRTSQPRIFRNPFFDYDVPPPPYAPPTFAATIDLFSDAELEEADRRWRGVRQNPTPEGNRFRDEESGSEGGEEEVRSLSGEAAQSRGHQCKEGHVRLGSWVLVAVLVIALVTAGLVVWVLVTQ